MLETCVYVDSLGLRDVAAPEAAVAAAETTTAHGLVDEVVAAASATSERAAYQKARQSVKERSGKQESKRRGRTSHAASLDLPNVAPAKAAIAAVATAVVAAVAADSLVDEVVAAASAAHERAAGEGTWQHEGAPGRL